MMNKRYQCLLISLLFFSSLQFTWSQVDKDNERIYGHHEKICGSHLDKTKLRKLIDAEILQKNKNRFDQWLQDIGSPKRWSSEKLLNAKNRSNSIRQIPITFHLIASEEDGTMGKLLNKARIASALHDLNERYSDASINFCLATKYKTNTNQIKNLSTLSHYNKQLKVFSYPSLFNQYARLENNLTTYQEVNTHIKEATAIDNLHILNIWVTDRDMLGSNIMNHASFPDFRQVTNGLPGLVGYDDNITLNQSPYFSPFIWAEKHSHDGILIHTSNFGSLSERSRQYLEDQNFDTSDFNLFSSSGISSRHNEGAILAHEAGHYFSLFHTWGDSLGCVDGFHGDFVFGTPLQWGPTSASCLPSQQSLTIEQIQHPPRVCPNSTAPPLNSFEEQEAKLTLVQNLMSYADDNCKRSQNFVNEQIDRMQTSLDLAPNRKFLGIDEDNMSSDLENSIFCENDLVDLDDLSKQLNLEAVLYPVPVTKNTKLNLNIGDLSDSLVLDAYQIFSLDGKLISGQSNLNQNFNQAFQFTAPDYVGQYFVQFTFIDIKSGEPVSLTKPFVTK
ncbi:M43 family zinc metalloprotease [Bacteriovoracaceae bacterium]|nr:M43 family zinc metalloprotease [Bacteriovoracaceae bacterium]